MSDIHLDGFEQFGGNASAASVMQRADYLTVGAISPTSGRIQAGRALSCMHARFTRVHAWGGNKFSTGAAITFNNRGSMMSLKFGTEMLMMWTDPDMGLPMMNGQPGGALPLKDTWYYYEIECDRAAGKASLFLNNRFDMEFTMTAGMLAATSVEVGLGWYEPADYIPGSTLNDNSAKSYDDFYIRDGDKLNPITITTRFPTTDEVTQWIKGSNFASHAQVVATLPPNTTDSYLSANQQNEEDRFTCNTVMTNPNEIVASGLVVLARKSPELTAKLGVYLGGHGAAAELREKALTVDTTWRTQYACFDKISSDNVANFTAAPFGIIVTN